jgi:hypothetical protein
MVFAMSGCVYHEWVHTAAAQDDYPQLIEHVRSNEELQAQLDKRTEKIFREGEYVENWQDIGVDVAAVLQERPGGFEQNFLYTSRLGLISLQYYHPHDNLLGPDYRTFHVNGPEELFSRGTAVSHSLTRVAPGVWVAMATEYTKTGKAYCAQRTAVRLHARRALVDLSTSEAGHLASLIAGTQRMDHNPRNCSVWVPAGDSQWRAMHFTPDGTRLPAADRDEGPTRIVPFAEVRRILSED